MSAHVKAEPEIAENPPAEEDHKKYFTGTIVIGTIKAVGLDNYLKDIHHETTVEIKYDFDKKEIVCGVCKGYWAHCDHIRAFRVMMGENIEDILMSALLAKGTERP